MCERKNIFKKVVIMTMYFSYFSFKCSLWRCNNFRLAMILLELFSDRPFYCRLLNSFNRAPVDDLHNRLTLLSR